MASRCLPVPLTHQSPLHLPAEIRNHILEYIFAADLFRDGFRGHGAAEGICIDEEHTVSRQLQPLCVCKQFYHDANLMALSRGKFVVANLFFNIPQRLSILHPRQIQALRSIAFVADARHFRRILDWGDHAFGIPLLRLETLTVVLHRSSFWHYLFDFTADIVKLLRRLEGVGRFVFVRNNARVKGSFKTWYNRLIGLMMKIDHHERYMKCPPSVEKTWWTWSFDDAAQTFCLEALPSKPLVDEVTYMQEMFPLLDQLRISVESEEINPDPRSWNGT